MDSIKFRSVVTGHLLVAFLWTQQATGGFERADAGARIAALGSSFVGLADDSWAMLQNPAGLSQIGRPEVSLFYSPQPFGVSELRSVGLVTTFPSPLGTFGVSARRFGFALYRETSVGVAYAKTLERIHVGAHVGYYAVSILNYGSATTVGVDVGILVPIVPVLRWGIAGKNINAPKIGQAKEALPQVFTLGLSYQPLSSLSFLLDYEKELGFTASPRFGSEYWIVDEVALRVGTTLEPALYTVGLGVRYSLVQLDYAFSTHHELGGTHQLSVTLRWISGNE